MAQSEEQRERIAGVANVLTGNTGRVTEGVAELAEAEEQARAARAGGASLVEAAEAAASSLKDAAPQAEKPREVLRQTGLLHLYCGDGKGKTSAAMGLALRALGHGRLVTVVQFLKDGTSGELGPLQTLGAAVFSGVSGGKFAWQMTDEEKARVRLAQTAHLKAALELESDLVVLDEACAAWQLDLVDHELLKRAVLQRPAGCEMVITGRDPADWMYEAADYVTCMACQKHPFERGVPAREGVEY